jgi:DNA polymerase-3 subunit epsilon
LDYIGWFALAALLAFFLLLLKHLGSPSDPSVDPSQKRASPEPFQRRPSPIDLKAVLPPKFVVFDLETTGLDAGADQVIEIGAIRVNRDGDVHDTFQRLVKPTRKIPGAITRLNGISQEMVDMEGIPSETAMREFVDFIQDLPLVSFNAEFDMAFLQHLALQHGIVIHNSASCALKTARLAWPGRNSYRLDDLSKDGGLSRGDTHRALADCRRTLIVYTSAVSVLGRTIPATYKRSLQPRNGVSCSMQAYLRTSRIPSDPVDRNLLGIELERTNRIDEAIQCYQANVRDGFKGSHPYDRLAIIFRRRKDAASEIAVLNRAVDVYSQLQGDSVLNPKLEKFKKRLERVSGRAVKKASPVVQT